MKHLLFFLALLLNLSLSAQNYSIRGTVTDATDGVALPGAHIQLTHQVTNLQNAEVSGPDGKFLFDQLRGGPYTLKVTFLGYLEYSQEVVLRGQSLDMGVLKLVEDAIQLQTIQVIEQALPTMQKGDTTEINAQAFKTLPDATAEDLITKMPTVTVQDGKVQAQGEEVKQVLVDGKPFFGNDPTAALRSLPAEVVDKIQVFDQQSDQAQFTGFQDGETSKTINIITKSTMKAGQFGKVYAGYGYPDLYQGGGQVNIFKKNRRISLIGMSNNINQQNFATEDLLGVVGSSAQRRGGPGGGPGPGGYRGGGSDFLVSQQGGITQTHAFGVNFSDKWWNKADVTASYFFNWAGNTLEKNTDRLFANSSEVPESYSEKSFNETTNINHRFNARVEFQIDSSNSLIFRPQFTWQSNDGTSDMFSSNLSGNTLKSEIDRLYSAELETLRTNGSLLWRHKFAKDRRTVSIDLEGGYAPKREESFLLSQNNYYGDTLSSADTLDQFATLEAFNWNSEIDLDYTEPIGKNGMLMAEYEISLKRDDSDRETLDYLQSTQSYSSLNEQLSNVFSNDYLTHRAGAGYNWGNGKMNFMVRANYQRAELINEQTFPQTTGIERTFDNFLPMAMFRYDKSRTDNLRVFYRAGTRLPSIDQMQNVLNNNNPLQLSVGNPNLVQALEHRVFSRYSKTNTEKSTVLFVLLSGSLTDNYIANSTYLSESDDPIFAQYEVPKGAQISTPVNLDGYRNARAMVTYGFPVKPLKLQLNLDLSGSYTRTPGLIDKELNFANNTNSGLGLTIASNISDKIDFSVSSRTSYNWVTNTLQTDRNSNYLSQAAQLKFNWIIWKGITFRSDLTYQYFDGLSEDFDPNYWLWSMSLGKKVFKNDRGEINLAVFDLLRQNNSLSRTVTETYYEDVQTNVLQQFFMLNFVYQIRNFGNAPEQPKGDMGPPPMGPGHFH